MNCGAVLFIGQEGIIICKIVVSEQWSEISLAEGQKQIAFGFAQGRLATYHPQTGGRLGSRSHPSDEYLSLGPRFAQNDGALSDYSIMRMIHAFARAKRPGGGGCRWAGKLTEYISSVEIKDGVKRGAEPEKFSSRPV